MKAKVVFSLILVIVVAVFTLQNTEVVDISFLFWHFALSRALLIFILLALGLLGGLLLGSLSRSRNSRNA